MSSPLDRFKKYSIGSSARYTDVIGVIEPSAELKEYRNLDVIMNSWYNILRTPVRTHISDPEFGTSLFSMIFEPATQISADFIKSEVQEKLTKYDDRASVSKIDVYFFSDLKGFSIEITANYKGEEKELKIDYTENLYRNFFD